MLKYILILLLIALPCYSQDINVDYNSDMLNYFIRNVDIIESVNGDTIIGIPIQKTFNKKDRSMWVDGYWTQYSGDSDDLELKQIKCKMVVINFSTKHITKVQDQNNDILDWLRPNDLYNKVNDKLKEKMP